VQRHQQRSYLRVRGLAGKQFTHYGARFFPAEGSTMVRNFAKRVNDHGIVGYYQEERALKESKSA
jgi:hypothetical protein